MSDWVARYRALGEMIAVTKDCEATTALQQQRLLPSPGLKLSCACLLDLSFQCLSNLLVERVERLNVTRELTTAIRAAVPKPICRLQIYVLAEEAEMSDCSHCSGARSGVPIFKRPRCGRMIALALMLTRSTYFRRTSNQPKSGARVTFASS
jgi:hypothetical protein